MPKTLTAVAVDVTSKGTQIIFFRITRNEDGTLTAEVAKREPVKRNEKQSSNQPPTDETAT